MNEPHVPDEFHVPEPRTLLEATGIALIIALVVSVFFILPAEYGIDPTGFGGTIGITDMAAPSAAGAQVHASADSSFRSDSTNITIPPRSGLEYKFLLDGGAGFVYTWRATTPLYFDFHGEPLNDTTGYFESYQIDTDDGADGSFNAPFAGTHGWYWRNDGADPVTVTLSTAGHYDVVGIK